MRVVHSASDFFEALTSAQREASKAFGDSDVLVEKYIVRRYCLEFWCCKRYLRQSCCSSAQSVGDSADCNYCFKHRLSH